MVRRFFVISILALVLSLAPMAALAGSAVNINTAPAEELQSLTGVGPALAERIIEHRQEFPFESIEDIMQVSGIGETRFNEIKDYIAVE